MTKISAKQQKVTRMDTKYIDIVPIFQFNQSIRDLLHYLLQNDVNASHIILCDARKKPCGIIHTGKLYKEIAFGLQFDHVLESISDSDYVTLPQNCSFINPELIAGRTIIVTSDDGCCIGIANKTALLVNHIQSDETYRKKVSKSFFADLNFGFILSDIHGNVLSLNTAAKRILCKTGIASMGTIDDMIPKFNYSNLKQTYHASYDDISLEIQAYPYFEEGEPVKIALFLFNMSDLYASKKSLAEVKAKYRELLEIANHSYDEIYVTDSTGLCVFVNKACERIYGLKREDMLGRTSAQMKANGFISSDLSEKVIQMKHRLRDIQTTKIGQKILVIASPIFDKNGDVRRVVINSREIADMMDVRISADNLSRQNCTNITHKLTDLTLKSNKIVAESESMCKVIRQVTRISQTDAHVLLFGETGVGKDVIATLIHEISSRRNHNLVRLNCGAVSGDLIEAELFGCEKGPADSRESGRTGLFALADKSTLFLDEIDEFPYHLQGKLLHAIDDKNYTPMGSSRPVSSDFRLIAATSRNLPELVREGRFREDLYYRLNVMSVTIPPLRERRDDIPFLVQNVLCSINKSAGTQTAISPEAIERLKRHTWNGNIRELKNILEKLCILSDGIRITEKDLLLLPEFAPGNAFPADDYSSLIGQQELPAILDLFEKRLLCSSMQQCDSTYSLGKLLGISQATAVRKLQKYGLKF
jgi:PAS domain S-box-containing protein